MNDDAPTRRVLFVEDAFDQALVVRSFFQAMGGWEVVHSQDGDQAVALLREQNWDLLVTDLNLPGTDGFEVIRVAREAHPALPIIATTGYTGAAYHEQAFRSGATELLTKPLDRDEFTARVAQLTGAEAGAEGAPAVLALGGLPGDVEMGCGGALLLEAARGHRVVVVVLGGDDADVAPAGMEGARQAAQALGAHLATEQVPASTEERLGLVERIVAEERPVRLYAPSMDDSHPARTEASRIARSVAHGAEVHAYQTATTGFDYHPTLFLDVGGVLMDKMEALSAFQAAGVARPELSPRIAQAYARYWGRFQGFAEVEPFEVMVAE